MTGEETAYPEFEGLLALAQESVRRDGSFCDPVKMHMWKGLPGDLYWRRSVLLHNRPTTLVDIHMLLLAHGQGIRPPLRECDRRRRDELAAAAKAREEEAARRVAALDGEWRLLCEALPVPVMVAYNYSGGLHLESYTSGADHIIVCEPVTVGRFSRLAGNALCTTESTARRQDFSAPDEPDRRRPTCKACLRRAARLTGRPAGLLLTQRR